MPFAPLDQANSRLESQLRANHIPVNYLMDARASCVLFDADDSSKNATPSGSGVFAHVWQKVGYRPFRTGRAEERLGLTTGMLSGAGSST
jgi:hypothetical protein